MLVALSPEALNKAPSPAMAEWATNLAVQGKLDVRRRAGWNGTDLPSYSPQKLFPPVPLKGGGRVPAQILLGVLSQESNLVQANSKAATGDASIAWDALAFEPQHGKPSDAVTPPAGPSTE